MPFSAETRRANLERMADRELDVLVIGGGITGCGVALDAASRGLSVGLVEREDFAAGTSGRSSRMVHGGLRYLQHGDFAVVHESLRERAILHRLAPHLIHPVPMYMPLPRRRSRTLVRLGLTVYDAMSVGSRMDRHRVVDEREMRRAAPGLARAAPGVVYHEFRTDDARLTLEVARTAQAFGAFLANHAPVEGLLGDGRVRGARVLDRVSGRTLEIRARVTVNAAGVWADRVHGMATGAPRLLRPSKGVHLVFRPGALDVRAAVGLPSAAGDGRWIFVMPWADRTYAGTTDTDYRGDLDDPRVTEEDRAYILEAVARTFPSVAEADVVAGWAGLRPLLGGEEGRTADLSRRHAIYEDPPGLLTITGGKLTTYRAMAEELVDRTAARLGSRVGCRTLVIPLGMRGPLRLALDRAASAAEGLGLPPEAGRRLVYRYGDDWEEALGLVREEPSLGQPVVDGLPVLGVELEVARTREMAITEEDVLVRRTRLTTLDQTVRPSAGSAGG